MLVAPPLAVCYPFATGMSDATPRLVDYLITVGISSKFEVESWWEGGTILLLLAYFDPPVAGRFAGLTAVFFFS